MIQDFSMPEKILFFQYQDFEIRDCAFFQSRPCLNECTVLSTTLLAPLAFDNCLTFRLFDALLENGLQPAVVLTDVVQDGNVAGFHGTFQVTNNVATTTLEQTKTL